VNYVEQQQSLRAYRRTWLVWFALFGLIVAGLFNEAATSISWPVATICLLLAVATAFGAYYLPLYLGLTVERRKRYTWVVKVHPVAMGLLLVLAVPWLRSLGQWLAWLACLAITAVGVLAARRALKLNEDVDAVPPVPLGLFVGDLIVVLIAVNQGAGAVVACVIGLAFATTVFLVSAEGRTRWFGLLSAAAALACIPGIGSSWRFAVFAILVEAVVASGTLVLAQMAGRQHLANVSATVDELTAFALVTPEYAEEMLVTATGILARNWNEDPPLDPDSVGRWYEANSEYYLYDLAQFHLAYKHIRFMLDIVELADGRILDYGAGIGDLVLELARRRHDVTYLDVDGRTKAFARWRAERDWLPVTFASNLDEVDGPFDTIISLDVFEHLAEPLPVVDGLVEKLAPGGRMIVTAYFGATKSHPMHFDHDIDLGAYLRAAGLVDRKSFAMKHLRSQFMGKPGVLVYEKPD
jgi:SAM-dependent methyltransferase